MSEPVTALTSTITSESPKCFGEKGKVILSASGGWNNYKYKLSNWSDDRYQTSPEIGDLADGTYSVIIKDGNGCLFTIPSLPITSPPALTITSSNQLPTSCKNAQNGQIDLNLSGGTGTVNYSITGNNGYSKSGSFNSNDNVPLSSLKVGSYTVSLKDANLCSNSQTFEITPTPDSISISSNIIAIDSATCKQLSDGVANITVIGGSRPAMDYSLLVGTNWRPFKEGKDTAFVRLLSSNGNTISVKDAQNCVASVPYSIPIKKNHFQIETFPTVATCKQVTDGRVKAQRKTETGVYGNIDFSFNDTTKSSNDAANYYNIGVSSNQYLVKAQNFDGCRDSSYFTINPSPTALKLSIPTIIRDAACTGNGTGIVNVRRNTGTGIGNVYFSLPDSAPKIGPNEVKFYNLKPENYEVKAFDTKGCRDSAIFTISVRADSLNFKPYVLKNAACANSPSGVIVGSSKVNKTKSGWGPITYSLLSQNKVSKDTVLFERLIQDNYVVSAEDSVGCNQSVSLNVIALPNPIHFTTPVKKQQSCTEVENGSIEISATSSSDIKKFKFYNPTLKDTSDWQNSVTYNNLKGSSYALMVVDTNRCSRDTVVTLVNLHNNPTLKVNSIDSLFCANDKTGVIRFKLFQKWRKPAYKFYLNGVLNPTDSIFSNRSAKNDTILVVDADGCPGDTIMNVPVLANTIRFNPNPYFTHASCMAAKNGT
ncbi:MAG TPA: SprB repeat-containing protein, partial [Chitinophagaceae bacterium]|nr:SprB repeat-containing protein [Chitinophagaceae bacterium]